MNSYLQVVLTGLITLLSSAASSAIVAVFFYGKLTQQVKDLVGWNKRQDERLDKHEERISLHASEIAYLKGHKGIPMGVE